MVCKGWEGLWMQIQHAGFTSAYWQHAWIRCWHDAPQVPHLDTRHKDHHCVVHWEAHRKPTAGLLGVPTTCQWWDFPGGAVVQNCLPMQGPGVWSVVWEDPTRCRAAKPVCHLSQQVAITEAHTQQWRPSAANTDNAQILKYIYQLFLHRGKQMKMTTEW